MKYRLYRNIPTYAGLRARIGLGTYYSPGARFEVTWVMATFPCTKEYAQNTTTTTSYSISHRCYKKLFYLFGMKK